MTAHLLHWSGSELFTLVKKIDLTKSISIKSELMKRGALVVQV